MEFIAGNKNYRGLAIKRDASGSLKWIATAKSDIGKARKGWAEKRARELGIPSRPGMYAKVMYAVHPTKMKVCQICGIEMSIGYIYPNVNFVKAIKKVFPIEIDIYDSVYDVWDGVVELGQDTSILVGLINSKFGTNFTKNDGKEKILLECEALCRLGGKKHFGPGAMSDFPDRYDGFHTYNRCHRPFEDKGRSADNLRSYTRDRRAYEYWSDGNVHAANRFMGSGRFKGASADHVGPISLGFIHDPRYLRVMVGSDNSAKRDRLSKEIIEEVIAIHKATGVYPMSWYSSAIWTYITEHYQDNEGIIATNYRRLLKKSISNFMFILKQISDLGEYGDDFLIRMLILPKRDDFLYDYKFDELGNITARSKRNITARAAGEFDRFARIALASVEEFSDKDNRHVSPSLTPDEQLALNEVQRLVQLKKYVDAYDHLTGLNLSIQKRLISELNAPR
jgi:Alw26I/Eco31I/Esp3I family type II restriction endonuclease